MKLIAMIISLMFIAESAFGQTQKLVTPGSAFVGDGPLANEQALAAFETQLNAVPTPQQEQQVSQAPIILQAEPAAPPETHIVIVEQQTQAMPDPAPFEPFALPTVQPVDVTTSIKTQVGGIDDITTRAVFSAELSSEQVDAVKKIVDNGVLIAQQRFGLEQYGLETSSQLSKLREAKSFALWGLLFSIPFLMTLYWGLGHLAIGWRQWRRDILAHKLRELESVERQIAGSEHHYHETQHS